MIIELNKKDIDFILSLITNEYKKIEAALNSSLDKGVRDEFKEDWDKHIDKLRHKLIKLEEVERKLSR